MDAQSLYTAVVVLVVLVMSSADPATTSQSKIDAYLESKQLITSVRELSSHAKEGTSLDLLHQNILDLQARIAQLITDLSLVDVSECETQMVIKMAATRIGSHEVLGLLVASDSLGVLSRRLALALAFLEQVAQQLEEEITLSRDVGPYYAALIFGTNTSLAIIQDAETTIKPLLPDKSHPGDLRVRRQLRTNVNLGRGWSVGLGGVNWRSSNEQVSFNLRPTFSGFRPDGFRATLTIRF